MAFYGVNAFKFTNAKGVSHYTRYQILPLAGEKALADAQAAKADPNYLMDELPKRIAAGPVKFKLAVQVANEGDPTNDATKLWPADRKVVELGDDHPDGRGERSGERAEGAALQPVVTD